MSQANNLVVLKDEEKILINQLQQGLPITEHPYRELAKQLSLTEQQIVDLIASLLERGILSRFGPMFDIVQSGGAFTLAAMQVPESRFHEVSTIVNRFNQVAHNYKRDHHLNMWFVIGCETVDEIDEVISQIEQQTQLRVYNFPKQEEFYVGLYLPA
jgi:DNA-binding Lrp family transcriptional regulator